MDEAEFRRKYHIPDLDFSCLDIEFTDDEADAIVAKMNRNVSGAERRAFVAEVKAHPERLGSWDGPMSFSEYARRVEVGEYD